MGNFISDAEMEKLESSTSVPAKETTKKFLSDEEMQKLESEGPTQEEQLAIQKEEPTPDPVSDAIKDAFRFNPIGQAVDWISDPEKQEARARGVADTAAFGITDEVIGGASAGYKKLQGLLQGKETAPISELYQQERNIQRERAKELEERYPRESIEGQVVGAFVPTGAASVIGKVAKGASSLIGLGKAAETVEKAAEVTSKVADNIDKAADALKLKSLTPAAKAGKGLNTALKAASEGAAYSYGSSEAEGLPEQLKETAIGGGIGFGAGVLGSGLGVIANKASNLPFFQQGKAGLKLGLKGRTAAAADAGKVLNEDIQVLSKDIKDEIIQSTKKNVGEKIGDIFDSLHSYQGNYIPGKSTQDIKIDITELKKELADTLSELGGVASSDASAIASKFGLESNGLGGFKVKDNAIYSYTVPELRRLIKEVYKAGGKGAEAIGAGGWMLNSFREGLTSKFKDILKPEVYNQLLNQNKLFSTASRIERRIGDGIKYGDETVDLMEGIIKKANENAGVDAVKKEFLADVEVLSPSGAKKYGNIINDLSESSELIGKGDAALLMGMPKHASPSYAGTIGEAGGALIRDFTPKVENQLMKQALSSGKESVKNIIRAIKSLRPEEAARRASLYYLLKSELLKPGE